MNVTSWAENKSAKSRGVTKEPQKPWSHPPKQIPVQRVQSQCANEKHSCVHSNRKA